MQTILVVDDDERNILALSAVLRSKGFKIESALDGREGLRKLKSCPEIEIVLMDIMMPVMNGYETINEIRNDKSFCEIPIIALTANAMEGDREKCLAAGASDYCAKPVEIEELLQKIRNCILTKVKININ